MATRPIDEKIVAMKMDNSDFKQKAAETTGIFGKLRDALNRIPGINLSKPAKELDGIRNAASRIDLSKLSSAADAITSRFSNLGVVATTALVNITNRAVNAGIQLYKSFTIAPIMDGFHEYETKIGSIGTILANTEWQGTKLDDVKRALNDLNNYADKTIYNFGQMTENIGRFTAAGVKLDDSTVAIKGLGNLAAISGSTSEQLNTAMYQMSQALASGTLNLEDWNSLVNAGMAGKKTQDALVATAKAMGKNVNLSKGFRNSIHSGWLTSEVFLETLKKFGKDKSMIEAATKVRTFTQAVDTIREGVGSGWATTWELIFGDFEQATKRWTAVSNVVGGFFQKQTDARNKLVKSLADKGVFQAMFDGFTSVGETVLKVMSAISNGFSKVFGSVNLSWVSSMAQGFKNFMSSLKPSEKTLNNISTIFQAMGSVIMTVVHIATALAKTLINLIPPNLFSNIVAFVAYLARMVIAFTDGVNSGEKLKSTSGGLTGVFSVLGRAVSGIVKGFGELGDIVSEVWNILSNGKITSNGPWSEDSKIVDWLLKIRTAFQAIGDYLSGIQWSFEPVANAFSKFFELIGKGFEWIRDKMESIGDAISKALPSGNQLLAGGFIAGLATIAWKTFSFVKDIVSGFKSWFEIGDSAKEVLENVSGALKSFSAQVKAQALLTIAIAVGVLAAAFLIMSGLDGKKIANGLYAIIGSLSALVGAMAIMTKYDITGTGMKAAIQIVALSIAFSIMAGALRKLSDMGWADITKGMYGLVGVMGVFSGAVALISKFGGVKLGASALQLIAMAGAVYLMFSAIKKISTINVGSLTKGVTTMGIVMAEMGLFLKLAGGSKFGVGSTLGMLAVGKAIMSITSAIEKISKIKVGSLILGLTVIGLILTEITLFTRLTSDKGLLSAGIGMAFIATALMALIVPIGTLGKMKLSTLAKGLTAMSVALGAIALASKLMTGLIATGAGLVLVAGALTLLLIPIAAFAAMGWGPMLTGLAGLALALGIVGGAALLLAPAIPALALFGVAILALGAGMALAGVGMMAFGAGLMTLATMTAGAVTSIVAVLGTLIVGLASLIPSAVDFIMKLASQIASALVQYAPIIATKISELIIKLLEVLTKYGPQFLEKGVDFILSLMQGFSKEVPRLVDGGTKCMIDFINGMAQAIQENGPKLNAAILGLIGEILILVINGGVQMINAFLGWIPGVKDATAKMSKTAEQYIRDNFGAKKVGSDKGKDFADGLRGKSGDAKSAGSNVGKNAESGANSSNLKTIGTKKGTDFASAMAAKNGFAKISGKGLANAGKDGAGSVSLHSTGVHFGEGFANGIDNQSTLSKVASAAKSLAQTAWSHVRSWLNINSPSRKMMIDGGWFGEGFALGIANKTGRVGSMAEKLATTARDSLNDFIDGFELPDSDNELHFKAVIDYDRLDASKFGSVSSLGISPNATLTASMVPSPSSIIPSIAAIGQNNDNSEMIRKQDEQINMMQKQIDLLSDISAKDNSVYLDGKELYNSNQRIQNSQISIRNIFKGVVTP